jgi:hypothetical protein
MSTQHPSPRDAAYYAALSAAVESHEYTVGELEYGPAHPAAALTGAVLAAPAHTAERIVAVAAAAAGIPPPQFAGGSAAVALPGGGTLLVVVVAAGETALPRSVTLTVPDLDAATARVTAAVPDAAITAAGRVAYVAVAGFKLRLLAA